MKIIETCISLEKYLATRSLSETLCAPLEIEDYIPQAVEFTSPPKWHLAHTTWFFEALILKKHLANYAEFHKDFNFLFNSYYQTVGERAVRSRRGIMSRPTVKSVYDYRSYVNKHMIQLLNNSTSKELSELVELGINHEQQHQELLISDLKYTFSLNPVFPVYHQEKCYVLDKNTQQGWLQIEEGIYEIGHNNHDFCYDNELGKHQVFLHDFQISKSLVTNGEFIEFMEDGGYQNFKHWLDEGWSWVQSNGIKAPLYWHKIDGAWHYYTLAGLQLVDPDAILSHVSFYEASAFASWKGFRLPTEFEWEVASSKLDWGKRWEWTNSAYLPYPKFTIAPGAVGEYNGKFMVNQMVLRGGSVATTKGHSRATYRNFFHPKYQWQFTGIRLAK